MRKQHWPKRDPIKNYFPLPNEIYQLGLSPRRLPSTATCSPSRTGRRMRPTLHATPSGMRRR